jgi:hypothetical protein
MPKPFITKYGTSEPYLEQVAAGQILGHSLVHKFGKNPSVGTSYVPVTQGGIYRTPQAASATTLRIKAGGHADDTAAGDGAREVTLIGLDETGAEITVTVATNGASASTATTETFMRLYRAYVSASGTYATASAGSHTSAIVIENGAGGTDWATIDATGFAKGQSEIGVYSIPDGHNGYLLSTEVFSDSAKVTEILFFQRTGILQAAAPYDAMRVVFEERMEGGETTIDFRAPIKFVGPADVGILAKVSATTAEVDVDFELLIVKNDS